MMAAGYVNIYECPHGCKAQGDKPIAASIRGWKKHMTRNHGGYAQEQLDTILSQPVSGEGKADMFAERALDAIGEPFTQEGEAPVASEGVTGQPAAPDAVRLKKEAMARKFSTKLNKMREALAERLTAGVDLIAKDKGDEWGMSDKDREFLSESFENAFDVLEVDFAIQPIQKQLSNPLWVLLLPIVALAMIFLPKVMQAAAQKKDEEKSDAT